MALDVITVYRNSSSLPHFFLYPCTVPPFENKFPTELKKIAIRGTWDHKKLEL